MISTLVFIAKLTLAQSQDSKVGSADLGRAADPPYLNILFRTKNMVSDNDIYGIKTSLLAHAQNETAKLNSRGQLQIQISNDFVALFDSSLPQLRMLRAKQSLLTLVKSHKSRVPFSYSELTTELKELLATSLAKRLVNAEFQSDTKLVISPKYHQDFQAEGFRFGFGAIDMQRTKRPTKLIPGLPQEDDPVEKELSAHGVKIKDHTSKVEASSKHVLTYFSAPLKSPRDRLMGESLALRDFALWVQRENEKLDQVLEELYRSHPALGKELDSKQYKAVEEIARSDPKKFEQLEMFSEAQMIMNGVPESKRRELLMKCSITHSFSIVLGVVVQGTSEWVTLDFGENSNWAE